MNRPWPEFCNRAAHTTGTLDAIGGWGGRSGEGRVGKEGRSRGGPDHLKKKKKTGAQSLTETTSCRHVRNKHHTQNATRRTLAKPNLTIKSKQAAIYIDGAGACNSTQRRL